MDALAKEYEGAVDFVFIYCDDRHAFNPEPTRSREQRVEQARLFRQLTKARKLILIDEFGDRGVKHLYGAHGNSAFVIDHEGRLAAKMAKASPLVLDELLEDLLSPKQ